MALVRVYCGLASADESVRTASAVTPLTIAVVDDAGRLLGVHEISDDPSGYATLGTLLVERTSGFSDAAVAADSDDHLITSLLTAAGRPLVVADDDAADDYAERFADDDAPEEQEAPPAARRAVGLARALQAGAIAAVTVPTARELISYKPVLAAHVAMLSGRNGAAIALREVLRELYPAALRAYPDPSHPLALAVLDALPEPGKLTARGADGSEIAEQVAAELTRAGVGTADQVSAAVTALVVAISESPRRGGVNKSLAPAAADTVRQAIGAVRSCDNACEALIGTLIARSGTQTGSTAGRRTSGSRRAAEPAPSNVQPLRPAGADRPAGMDRPARRGRPEPAAGNAPVVPHPLTAPPVAPEPLTPPPLAPAPLAPRPNAPAAAGGPLTSAPAAAAGPQPDGSAYPPAGSTYAGGGPGNRPVSVPPPPPGMTPIVPGARPPSSRPAGRSAAVPSPGRAASLPVTGAPYSDRPGALPPAAGPSSAPPLPAGAPSGPARPSSAPPGSFPSGPSPDAPGSFPSGPSSAPFGDRPGSLSPAAGPSSAPPLTGRPGSAPTSSPFGDRPGALPPAAGPSSAPPLTGRPGTAASGPFGDRPGSAASGPFEDRPGSAASGPFGDRPGSAASGPFGDRPGSAASGPFGDRPGSLPPAAGPSSAPPSNGRPGSAPTSSPFGDSPGALPPAAGPSSAPPLTGRPGSAPGGRPTSLPPAAGPSSAPPLPGRAGSVPPSSLPPSAQPPSSLPPSQPGRPGSPASGRPGGIPPAEAGQPFRPTITNAAMSSARAERQRTVIPPRPNTRQNPAANGATDYSLPMPAPRPDARADGRPADADQAPPGSRANWPLTNNGGDDAALTPAASTSSPPAPGRVRPPWQDMPVEPPVLRLVDSPLGSVPADVTAVTEPPPLRLVDRDSSNGRNGRSPRRTTLTALDRSTTPPVPAEGDGDLLIFAAARSAWFTGHTEAKEAVDWSTPSDTGWRAAEKAATPSVAAETTAGLPKRVPQANLVPGSPLREERPLRIVRDAASIAAHTTGYFRGWRRGQEIGGYAIGGRPGRESAGGWDFSREGQPEDYRNTDFQTN